jgi:hypothetical protein
MSKLIGVLINVGSSGSNPNGRGRIFDDFTFEYLPIPEERKTTERIPTYRELGFSHVKFPDLQVHLDPDFKTFTYGHVERGFGDIQSLLKLSKDGVLFFYAALQKETKWSTYVIGYFRNLQIHDCRGLSKSEILSLRQKGLAHNAHLKRVEPHVDLLIKGREGSKLETAFLLSEENNHLALRESLRDIVLTATGKKVTSGTPWFRWTLICNDSAKLLQMIEACQDYSH